MKRRTTTFAATLLAATVTLAACTSGSDETAADADRPTEMPTEDITLELWWWGEQEAPGAEQFIDEAIAAYQAENPNVTIIPTLQNTDALIPAFESAAAAGEGPDIQYFWGGIYSQQPGWNGNLVPVSDYIDAEELANYTNAATEASFEDVVWTAPWYVIPSFPMLSNTALLAEHGLTTPTTWDELLTTCDTLSAAGVTTLAGGVKDGWFGGWLYSMIGVQSLDGVDDVLSAVVGDSSFTDEAHAQWWERLAETSEHGCWNDDINSLELYQAQERFVAGEAAMTVVAGSDAANMAEQAGGPETIEIVAMPQWADGPLSGQIASSSQTLGISSWTEYPQVAADFIQFLHTPEQLQAWYDATGVLPADDRFDTSVAADDPFRSALFEAGRSGVPYLENFIPAQLDSDAVFANVQLVLSGDMAPADAAQAMQDTADRLRQTDRELVDNFTAWGEAQ
ncbi:MAG: ABC transporter substrate-binding protein [Beutenbergiaceae bacterium]